ncbi:MAG: ribonuclease III [Legionellaceae bacterium]|nr:ribonuclease III [Legionellaceae bacterium]
MINTDRLCRRLNYTFKKSAHLKQALTHCSAGSKNNERLEFLGDSILSMVIANALYEKFPNESEGKLSRLRAFLVKGETLAYIAQEIDLGDYLLLGQGELKSGGFRRASILADTLEAVFAAVFLDGGIEESQKVILSLYKQRLNDDVLQKNLKDAKTQLQEYLQSKKYSLPVYTLTKVVGDEHDQEFHIHCSIPDVDLSSDGKGDNRRKAEQSAATKLLNILKK